MNEIDEVGGPGTLTMGRVKTTLHRQWWVVLLVCLAVAVGTAAYVEVRSPSYAANVTVFTGIPSAASSPGGTSSATASSFPVPTTDATSGQVVRAAAAGAGLSSSQVSLRATASPNQSQIALSVTAPTRLAATRAASGAAKSFVTIWAQHLDQLKAATAPQLASLRRELRTLGGQNGSATPRLGPGPTTSTVPSSPLAVEIEVVTDQYAALYNEQVQYQLAVAATKVARGGPSVSPVSSNKAEIVLIGLGVGLVAGCGVGLLRDVAQDRLSDPDELPELTEIALLAQLPKANIKRRSSVVSAFQGRVAEAARELRTTIALGRHRRPLQTLLVTSAAGKEGKSFTVSALGIAWAVSGAKTLLVSSDLRNPSLETMFGAPSGAPGLSQLLRPRPERSNGNGALSLSSASLVPLLVRTAVDGLFILPAGAPVSNPAELLGSQAMLDLVSVLKESFDVVIFDSPPALAVTDAVVLQQFVDEVVLVVASDRSAKANVRRAMQLLDRHANLCGFVLNFSPNSGLRSYRYTEDRLESHPTGVTPPQTVRVP
jgi:capsular exopolysaccharide synthesis family protein